MQILGIDPGYGTTGFALVEAHRGLHQLRQCGVITTPPGMDFPKRLETLYLDMDQLLKSALPEALAIEELFFGHYVTTGIGVDQARGIMLLAASQRDIPALEYKPMQVKQAVVGYGGASKHQVMDMTRRILKLEKLPRPDDAADAIAILEPGMAVVDCGGVGYACSVTAYTAAQLKLNQTARLYIHENIREDAFDLFGFASREEPRCFQLLLGVNGVGPKAALAILSSGGPQSFTLAVMTGDEKALTIAQGVGKKLAQRIILELRDKIGGAATELDFSGPVPAASPAGDSNLTLATAALQELGYSSAEIAAALKGCSATASTEEMVRYALRAMVNRS